MQTYIPVVNSNNPGKSTIYDFKHYKKSKRRSKTSGKIIDLVDLLSDILLTYGQKAMREGNWLRLDNGFWFLPQWVSSEVRDGSISTETTVEINHLTFIPNGFFDYQQVDVANSIAASFLTGLNQWVQVCAIPLCDSLLADPKNTNYAIMEFPNSAHVVMTGSGFSSEKTRLRRVIFGPVVYFMTRPDGGIQKSSIPFQSNDDEHNEYCPCCLLNRLSNIFMPFLNSDDYTIIQLRAFRDLDGDITAACYVNGKKFDRGRYALIEDIKTWPPRGAESRKNLFIVQNAPTT
jgi:hypothetical protein